MGHIYTWTLKRENVLPDMYQTPKTIVYTTYTYIIMKIMHIHIKYTIYNNTTPKNLFTRSQEKRTWEKTSCYERQDKEHPYTN